MPFPTVTLGFGQPPADHSIASMTSLSVQVLAFNPRRKYLFVQNVGTSPIGVNVSGGSAAISTPPTITLYPAGELEATSFVPTAAISIIGTAGQPVTVLSYES